MNTDGPRETQPVMRITNLCISLVRPGREDTELVHDVSFDLHQGRTSALVGESGSGKTLTARSIPGLLDDPLRITRGRVEFEGRDVSSCSAKELQALRGGRIAMIFQEPMVALNPVMTIGAQLIETIRQHHPITRAAARTRAIKALDEVEVAGGRQRLASYPHELSGGMRQRVMIAMALSGDPTVLLADEPTTALDVTIQSTILDLIDRLRAERGLAVLLITHDLGIVARCADDVIVMNAGHVVEQSENRAAITNPRHPYTRSLLDAAPRLSTRRSRLGVVGAAEDDRHWWPSVESGHGKLVEAEPGHSIRMVASP